MVTHNSLGLRIYGADGSGQMQTVLESADLGEDSSALAWLTGDFTGTGKTQIAKPWNTRPDLGDDAGRLGLLIYGADGSGQMQTVFESADVGQGSGALAWLAGDFTGTGKTQIAQPFNNNGRLGLLIYGADGSGQMQTVFESADVGQGAPALAWLAGDFTGTGKTQIAQPFNNNGRPGLLIYGADGSGQMQTVFESPDLGQGAPALAWLAGDFTGTGKSQIALPSKMNNNSPLGLLIYGADGSGQMQTVFESADVGEGPYSGVSWLAGDFTGSGKTQIAQPSVNNNSRLALLVLGWDGSGQMQTVFESTDLGQRAAAVAWLTGDFTGSGKTQIAQPFNNNGRLGLLIYGADGSGQMQTVFGSHDVGQRAAAVAWLAGDFTGTGKTQIAQPWTNRLVIHAGDPPWLKWPCNYYTYRNTLAPDDDLRKMQQELATFTITTEAVDLWLPRGITQNTLDQLKDRASDGALAIGSLLLWDHAVSEFGRGRYRSAVHELQACQRSIVKYFAARYPHLADLTLPPPAASGEDIPGQGNPLSDALDRVMTHMMATNRPILTFFAERINVVTLDELYAYDWQRPEFAPLAYKYAKPLGDEPVQNFGTGLVALAVQLEILQGLQNSAGAVEEKIDAPLLAIALVFCELSIAEAYRRLRQFKKGIGHCEQLFTRNSRHEILVPTIELPFLKILWAQLLTDDADSQYKARTPAAGSPGELEAHKTYEDLLYHVFADEGRYVARVDAGTDAMATQLETLLQHTFHPVAAKAADPAAPPALTAADRKAFGLIGKTITIETIVSRQGEFPDPDRRIYPLESLITIDAVARETNPVIYSLVIQARSRLLQITAGLNYLGYSDEYVPPWRFQFLLDRARYFAEHAKNAQRDYLNFLTNAEREEFQELTAAQNVAMEKSNIRLETARVDQVRFEVFSAQESHELATLTASNAHQRAEDYEAFNTSATTHSDDVLASSRNGWMAGIGSGALSGAAAGSAGGPWGAAGGAILGGFLGLVSGGAQHSAEKAQAAIAEEQRDFEEKSLGLTASEARHAAVVAARQVTVAQWALVVAGLQRAAAVLRHESAIASLAFLRSRRVNTELWYRLATSIREVADTYLRYAVEMAFLAEQAYEFEADKKINVIRFDYDVPELGDMLAGDFLLRDLDTLEQDLIVGQRLRQQQVRFVISLAREFPDALQKLRTEGSTIFSVRLEQLERRFPGLFNLRIAAVEVLPIALMDPTRFSLELTHLGSGYVRLHTPPGTPDTSVPEAEWLGTQGEDWSVRLRTTSPETAVFSGLSRLDSSNGVAGFFAANQRGAFEAVAAASGWRVDLSMKENRIVADSLADLLVTFTLSGYYDANLRAAVDQSSRRPLATTMWLSANQSFPDAYYEFIQNGRMDWALTKEVLAPQGQVGALRNLGLLAVPVPDRPHFGRIMCSYSIEFKVDAAAKLTWLRPLPRLSFTTNGLTLMAALDTPTPSTVTFDFGDGTGLFATTGVLNHTYVRPGRYEVLVRIAAEEKLTEYRAAVVVSRQHAVAPPCVAVPDLNTSVAGAQVRLELAPTLQDHPELALSQRIEGVEADPNSNVASFLLDPGERTYVLRFTAVRPLSGRFYCSQRFDSTTAIGLSGLHVGSNRTFDPVTGDETTANLNPFGEHLFGGDALSPVDHWTLDLPLDANAPLISVSAADVRQHDLSELSDLFLTLEYPLEDP